MTSAFESDILGVIDAAAAAATDARAREVANRPSRFSWMNFADLAGRTPPEREWIVTDWIPVGDVTALFALGGIGKTLLAQQIATLLGGGRPVFGCGTEPTKVMGIFCEESHDELWRRQRAICDRFGVDMRGVCGNLLFEGRRGLDNVLWGFDHDTSALGPTAAWHDLTAAIERERPRLMIVDNAAQVFGGNENDRAHVTPFMNALAGWAVRYNIGVLLLGHTAKTTGSEFSGSTAWENVARSRWYMHREREPAVGGILGTETGRTILARRKANHSGTDELILQYDRGCFSIVGGASVAEDLSARLAREAAEARAERAVVAALGWLAVRSLRSYNAPNSPAYLPKVMAEHGLLDGCAVGAIKAAMTRMIGARRLAIGEIGRSGQRRAVYGLVLVPCAQSPAQSDE